jgi:chromatin modification-related protein YNG2
MDGEGEEEYEETGEGVEDDGIYCTCQRRIDGVGGEMIGCDNDNCPIQWVSLLFLMLPETYAERGAENEMKREKVLMNSTISIVLESKNLFPRFGIVQNVWCS